MNDLRMKIILVRYHDKGDINTRLPESLNKVRGVVPPLGIAYVAAVLEEAGYKVKIIDAIAQNLTSAEMREIILDEAPEIVGVTAMISNVRGALEAAKLAKECNVTTVLGGPLMSLYPREVLSYDFIDYGIIGEGEYPMLELAKSIERGLLVDSIKGLAYKKDGSVMVNGSYFVEDIDKLPLPSRHLLPIGKYSSIINQYPVTTMIASRGCPFKCGFCIKGPSDIKNRVRSPKLVVDEMESILNNLKVKEIMFYDDTLTLRKSFITSMCNEILTRGLKIRWESPTRVDCVDQELLKLMRRAGCVRLRYGVESGDPAILKLMNKGTDLTKVEDVFRWTKKAGIETFAYFIIGYIYETAKTIMNTISLAIKLNPDFVMFTVATPYPCTPLFEMSVKEGLADRDYWRDFVLGKRRERLPYLVTDAAVWVSRAYRKFYLRKGYVLNKILRIRNLRDIKRYLEAAKAIFSFRMAIDEG